MARMRVAPQGIDNPKIETFKRRHAVFRYSVDIRRIGGLSNAKSQRVNIAVLNLEG